MTMCAANQEKDLSGMKDGTTVVTVSSVINVWKFAQPELIYETEFSLNVLIVQLVLMLVMI